MPDLYLVCGLPGVGKTTWAKNFSTTHNITYIGIDDFYDKHNCNGIDRDYCFDAWIDMWKHIYNLGIKNISCIVEIAGITEVQRNQFLDWFPMFTFHLVYIDADKELRYKNNSNRDRVVPIDKMNAMETNLQVPTLNNLDKRWTSFVCIHNTILKKEGENND